ncbi:MAG: formate/nitrite transporter family protein [Chloroflexi bacterium]|nr:formate/nitrite transporter family protein [Chloroflexota bacterium]
MAIRAEAIGVKKAQTDALTVFVLAILGGAFIALGAIFSTVVTADSSHLLGYGLTKMLGGLAFCLGLILVVVGGAELFTGNNLIVMAWVNRRVSLNGLLTNWGLVYSGNFVGALGTVLLVFVGKHYTFGAGAVGRQALTLAAAKCDYEFAQAVALGILCNGLVCLAVWLTYSARTTTDKVIAIVFPVAAFVAAGFEHSVANMYFIPLGLLIKEFDSGWVAANAAGIDLSALTTTRFLLNNLLPVTIGNIIGGSGLVGVIYWFVYLRPQRESLTFRRRRAARTSPQR